MPRLFSITEKHMLFGFFAFFEAFVRRENHISSSSLQAPECKGILAGGFSVPERMGSNWFKKICLMRFYKFLQHAVPRLYPRGLLQRFKVRIGFPTKKHST